MDRSDLMQQWAERLEAIVEPRLSSFADEIQKLRQELIEVARTIAAESVSKDAQSDVLPRLKHAVHTIHQQKSQPNTLQAFADQAAGFAPRVLVFVIKGTNALGWIGHGFDEPVKSSLRQISVPLSTNSIVREAVRRQSAVMAAPQTHSSTIDLLKSLGPITPQAVAAVPLMVSGKVAGVLYADTRTSGKIELEALEVLSSACGVTLEVILSGSRKESSGALQPPPTSGVTSFLASTGALPSSSLGLSNPAPGGSTGDPFRTTEAPAPFPSPSRPLNGPFSNGSASLESKLSNGNGNGNNGNGNSSIGNSTMPDEHHEARRIARLLVQELVLYNQVILNEARQNRDIYNRMREDIDRSRDAYDRRVSSHVTATEDYFYNELVAVLGEGDPARLGPNCPGPRAITQ